MSNFTPSRISELLRRHGVTPSRRLGQHFLVDANLVGKIVKTAGIGPGRRVLEVGAGVGNLTAA
ncbi:MAG: 16S rRNA (adenine(1518)-N(6)/adenine(1519)-N(6))-dimethyltransferase, partial [bacterium]|nr:16S rRNA (adenine(1518)-N(6)/adenine(1519)-N(6))-dimethyltransferase [bacterium]